MYCRVQTNCILYKKNAILLNYTTVVHTTQYTVHSKILTDSKLLSGVCMILASIVIFSSICCLSPIEINWKHWVTMYHVERLLIQLLSVTEY